MSRSMALIVALAFVTGAASPAMMGEPARASTTLFTLPSQHADPVPFTSNGCSGFREGKFFGCCFVHDFAFWAGGTRSERRRADRALRQCLIDVTHGNLYDRIVADIGYMLLVMERVPGEVVPDGWGRGWPNTERRKYQALTPSQESAVAAERQRLCRQLSLESTTGMYRVNDTQRIPLVSARGLCGEMLTSGSK